jgi:hypothetical protein
MKGEVSRRYPGADKRQEIEGQNHFLIGQISGGVQGYPLAKRTLRFLQCVVSTIS